MKIAFIGIKGLPAKGGAERVVEAIVKRITPKGVFPVIYCDAAYTPPHFFIEGVEIIRVPTAPGKHFRTLSLVLFSTLHALIVGRYDLIHLHNIELSFVLPILRLKYKVLSTAHGFAYTRAKWGFMSKRIMKAMDYLFVKCSTLVSSVSAKDARELQSRFGKAVKYIPNGVGTEFHPDFKRAEKVLNRHGLRRDNYIIFIAGRIEPTKGAHLAIEAVNRLDKDIPLVVVGDDKQIEAYGEDLHRMAGPKIYFQPLIEDPGTLFGLMKYSLLLIFPSLVEAMSMVLLEAASFGVPIVCSDIEENKDVLGTEGIYFKSGDVESLISKISWVLDHRDDVYVNAHNLQKHIHDKYSWDSITNQYLNFYKEAICN
jgi:glycosyltransferase involved in cell wall biosynthesis